AWRISCAERARTALRSAASTGGERQPKYVLSACQGPEGPDAVALRGDQRREPGQHGRDRAFSLEQVDQVVGREPAGLEAAAERLERPGVESVGREHVGSAVENLRGPVGDRLGRQTLASDSAQVIDSRLLAGPTTKPIVQEQLEPEEEIRA